MESWRVLVVDDQEEIRELASIVLRDFAAWSVEAVDGLDGMRRVGPTFQPDVVLLDRALGLVSGEDVARALRGEAWFDRAALLFFTGSASLDDRMRHAELGAGTIAKPFDPMLLADQVRSEVARLGRLARSDV